MSEKKKSILLYIIYIVALATLTILAYFYHDNSPYNLPNAKLIFSIIQIFGAVTIGAYLFLKGDLLGKYSLMNVLVVISSVLFFVYFLSSGIIDLKLSELTFSLFMVSFLYKLKII